MPVSRYMLTPVGWAGAALFVLPTPLGAWHYANAFGKFAARGEYQRQLEAVQGTIPMPDLSPLLLSALATASLIGLVMIIVGREIRMD